MMTKLAAAILFAAAAAGADLPRTDHHAVSAVWVELSTEQRAMIDMVAQDIWETERRRRPVAYRELGVRQKNGLRAEAMDRLGFDPRPITGVEA